MELNIKLNSTVYDALKDISDVPQALLALPHQGNVKNTVLSTEVAEIVLRS